MNKAAAFGGPLRSAETNTLGDHQVTEGVLPVQALQSHLGGLAGPPRWPRFGRSTADGDVALATGDMNRSDVSR